MKQDAFFAFKKIKGLEHLLVAARHNKRADQFERGSRNHIEPTKTCLNQVFAGPPTPEEVMCIARQAMDAAGVKPRKGGVTAVEFVFSLHGDSGLDELAYFGSCLTWLARRYGSSNILSADVHFDESSPHMHILLLPMIDGRMRGSDLVDLKCWPELHARFISEVAEAHGLRAPPMRLTGRAKLCAEQQILQALQIRSDPALESAAWHAIRNAIGSNPRMFLTVLGLQETLAETGSGKARPKTFTQIMTGTGKRTEEDKNALKRR